MPSVMPRAEAETLRLVHGFFIKSKAIGRFHLPSRRPRACQDGGLGRMERIGGLGKHMTQSPKAVAGSQPNPACGLGLCQQQKNNTLPQRPGTMKVHALPLLHQWPTLCIQMSWSPRPPIRPTVHGSCQVPSGRQASCLVTPSW